ncbi:unnamed protein product [Trichobilharzia regenti]|nr:unnamed protein product [Trichobilharzia regenti]
MVLTGETLNNCKVVVELIYKSNSFALPTSHLKISALSGRPWSYIINILNNEASDSELLVYAMTLLNKTLNSIPDQDTFYDVTDCLEEMGMQKIVQCHLSKKNCDPELAEQLNLYEASLRYEDGEDVDELPLPASGRESLRQVRRMSRDQYLKTPEGEALLSSMHALPISQSMACEMDRALSRKSKRYQSVENLQHAGMPKKVSHASFHPSTKHNEPKSSNVFSSSRENKHDDNLGKDSKRKPEMNGPSINGQVEKKNIIITNSDPATMPTTTTTCSSQPSKRITLLYEEQLTIDEIDVTDDYVKDETETSSSHELTNSCEQDKALSTFVIVEPEEDSAPIELHPMPSHVQPENKGMVFYCFDEEHTLTPDAKNKLLRENELVSDVDATETSQELDEIPNQNGHCIEGEEEEEEKEEERKQASGKETENEGKGDHESGIEKSETIRYYCLFIDNIHFSHLVERFSN